MTGRSHKKLSLEDKSRILKKLEDGVQAKQLAIDFGVSAAAISQIKKKKNVISAAVASSLHDAKKTLHKSSYVELESTLYSWFLEQREKNCPVNGNVIRAKAIDIFAILYPERNSDEFNASNGWLARFKRRHGIQCSKICNIQSIAPFNNMPDCSDIIEEIEDSNAETDAAADADADVETDEVIDLNSGTDEQGCSDDDSIQEVIVSHADALNAVSTLIKWCQLNNQCTSKHLINLLAMRSDIVKKHLTNEE